MDIKQLDYFIKVCESGSFTAAAKKYFISPQGINMAVIRLEKELGKKLFIREKNSVVMTKDGEYLYKKAQEIISCVNECEAHFQRNFTLAINTYRRLIQLREERHRGYQYLCYGQCSAL